MAVIEGFNRFAGGSQDGFISVDPACRRIGPVAEQRKARMGFDIGQVMLLESLSQFMHGVG